MKLPGRRIRGSPQMRFIDMVKEDVKWVGVAQEDARDRMRRR